MQRYARATDLSMRIRVSCGVHGYRTTADLRKTGMSDPTVRIPYIHPNQSRKVPKAGHRNRVPKFDFKVSCEIPRRYLKLVLSDQLKCPLTEEGPSDCS